MRIRQAVVDSSVGRVQDFCSGPSTWPRESRWVRTHYKTRPVGLGAEQSGPAPTEENLGSIRPGTRPSLVGLSVFFFAWGWVLGVGCRLGYRFGG